MKLTVKLHFLCSTSAWIEGMKQNDEIKVLFSPFTCTGHQSSEARAHKLKPSRERRNTKIPFTYKVRTPSAIRLIWTILAHTKLEEKIIFSLLALLFSFKLKTRFFLLSSVEIILRKNLALSGVDYYYCGVEKLTATGIPLVKE